MLPSQGIVQWAGMSLDRPLVMGVLNVTPDSFSDGGRSARQRVAIAAGLALAANGADIVDVGGESTRPGALPVPPEVEQERILPVIEALAAKTICVSVDTRNASTMAAALKVGATIVNDVSGLAHDKDAAGVVAKHGCPVVLMHARGTPETMNQYAVYDDVIASVRAELALRIENAIRAGVAPRMIAIDPGIGFAKTATHSQTVLRRLPELAALGYPILVGVSRKSFIGAIAQEPDPSRRVGGSIAAALFALSRGASILRVHDVRETVQATRVWQTLFEAGRVSLPQHQGLQ
jgi:dihydropteroate synthase